MRKFLLAAVALVVLAYAGCRIRYALASDETKIRWLIEDAAEGFNDSHVRDTIGCLADDWHDRTTAIHKDTLIQFLQYSYFHDREEKTKRYRYRVEVPDDTITVTVDGDTATFRCVGYFDELKQGEFQPVWVVTFEGELERGDDGWEVTISGYQSLEGRAFRR